MCLVSLGFVGVVVASCMALSSGASAAQRDGRGRMPTFDPLPMRLPSSATARAAGARDWLIGTTISPAAERIAARHGARRIGDGGYRVPLSQARPMATELRRAGVLLLAEPNIRMRRASAPDANPGGWARGAVVPATLPIPALGNVEVGIIDDFVDPSHPDVGPSTAYLNDGVVEAAHGTEVASVVGAVAGNGGVVGVLPGVRLINYGVSATRGFSCADSVAAINAMISARVPVVNLSFGTSQQCASQHRAVEQAIGTGMTVVAAAGNEFEVGNPVEYPAAFPHVLSVAALRADLQPSDFSSANAAVDLSAPGEQVPVAVPLAFDTEDGSQDGVTTDSGTSFAAPMVAAAAAWVRAARPRLSTGQVADVLRFSATDLFSRGWDSSTGWGLVNVATALTASTPTEDPGEPNDDVPMVNGAYFGVADRPIFTGTGTRTIRATVDFAEDPADVYRIRMRGRTTVRITLAPTFGDPDLYVYDAAARTIYGRRAPIRSSFKNRGIDRVVLTNRARRTRTFYVAVAEGRTSGQIDAGYRLRITR